MYSLKLDLCSNVWSTLQHVEQTAEISVKSIYLHLSQMFLCSFFCWDVQSIGECGLLKTLSIIVLLLICSFISHNVYFMKLGVLPFSEYIYNYNVLLMGYSFNHYEVTLFISSYQCQYEIHSIRYCNVTSVCCLCLLLHSFTLKQCLS